MMSQTHFQPPTQTVSWVSELLNVIALAKIKHSRSMATLTRTNK